MYKTDLTRLKYVACDGERPLVVGPLTKEPLYFYFDFLQYHNRTIRWIKLGNTNYLYLMKHSVGA